MTEHRPRSQIAMVPTENILYNSKLELHPAQAGVKKYERLIGNSGNVMPVIVSVSDKGNMTLIHGAEALEACRNRDIREVPAILAALSSPDQEMLLSLYLQTLQIPTNTIAISSLLCRLMDEHNISRRQLSGLLGKSKSWLSLMERLNRKLAIGVKQMVSDELLCTRSAEEIARLPDNIQTEFAAHAVNGFLNKDQIKGLVERYLEPDCGQEERGAIIGDPARYLASHTTDLKHGHSLLSDGAQLIGYLRRCLGTCTSLAVFVRTIGFETILDAQCDIKILLNELASLQRTFLDFFDPGKQEEPSQ